MADRKKFEEMLELLINEDREAAEALFHEIVVEKSRDIYESLLEDEADVEEDEDLDEADDEEVDESDEDLDESEDEDDDEEMDEGFDLDEFEVEADPMDMGGDPTDDMLGDLGMDDEEGDDMDMDDEGEGDMEDRVDDLEDALEDLKAEFEKLMSGDEGDDMDMDDEEGEEGEEDEEGEEEKESFAFEDEEVEEEDDLEEAKKMMKKDDKKAKKTAGEEMREYVEKVGGAQYNQYGKMGDNGANTKSAVASKNDMGGTTQNILRTDTEAGVEANKGKLKGSALSDQSPKDMNTNNINVPGGKAGKTAFKKSEPGHGAEKKGKPETADKGATSTLNKLSSRAK